MSDDPQIHESTQVPSKANTILQTVGGLIVALGGVAAAILGLLPVWRGTGDPNLWLVLLGFGVALIATTIVDLKGAVGAYKELRK